MILAGDIGGTNTRLAIFGLEGTRLEPLAARTYPSREHGSLDEIVRQFTSGGQHEIRQACFGIAGPVRDGRSETTNLAWVVDARALAGLLGLPEVSLINDLESNAWGIEALRPEDFETLREGSPEARGNRAVVSAGTGLGEAGLCWDGRRLLPFATEGGHTAFAPRTEQQIELLRFLSAEFGRVSVERVLSGPGLHNLYRFLRDTGGGGEPGWLKEEMERDGAPAAISKAALAGRSETCLRALDLFVSIYGAEAGDLALKMMATGGVFLGGGIAPRILPKLKEPAFLEAFDDKGRMRPLVEAMPVRVILNDRTALIGAARCAAVRASLL